MKNMGILQNHFYQSCKQTQDAKRKVQVGNDQENALSEKRFPLQKPRREITKLTIRLYNLYHENIS